MCTVVTLICQMLTIIDHVESITHQIYIHILSHRCVVINFKCGMTYVKELFANANQLNA